MSLLRVRDLRVDVVGPPRLAIVRGVDLDVGEGEVLALVGESGAGKSALALALAALHPSTVRVEGSVVAAGEELVGRPERALERLRGRVVGSVFQDPSSALHPLLRVGDQLVEGLGRGALGRAEALLAELGLAEPGRALRCHPHELSGGMRQRALVAMALLRAPRLLVLDEVTTALDAITRLRVADVIRAHVREHGAAAVFLTHDLPLAARVADRAAVLYAGRIVERGPAARVLSAPRHPYAAGLVASTPSIDRQDPPAPIPGAAPSPRDEPPGCAFAPRCARRLARCDGERPPLAPGDPDAAACFAPFDADPPPAGSAAG